MQRRTFLVSAASILGLVACGRARAQHTPATWIARLQEPGKAVDELGKATDKLGKAIDAAGDALTLILYRFRHLVVNAADGSDAVKMPCAASQLYGTCALVIYLISTHEILALRLAIYSFRAEEADGFSRKRLWTGLIEKIRSDLPKRVAMLARVKENCRDVMLEPACAKLIETLYARFSFLQALSDRQALSTPAALREAREATRRHDKLIHMLLKQLHVARDEMHRYLKGLEK